MNKTIKKIILIILILVLIGIGASFFAGNSSQIQNPLQSVITGDIATPLAQNNTGVSVNTEQINREFVSMLLNLQSITLTNDIFSEPAFAALIDNTVRLNQPGNEGRPNPFAPIGSDALSNSTTTSQPASVSDAVDSMNQSSSNTAAGTDDTVNDPSQQDTVGESQNQSSQDDLLEQLSSLGGS